MLLLLSVFLLLSCSEDCDDTRFTYNPLFGKCYRCGELGLNPYDSAILFVEKNGECMDLSPLEAAGSTNNTPIEITGIDFRGAVFGETWFFLYWFPDSKVEGTYMRDVTLFYSFIDGTYDDFTVFPENAGCLELSPGLMRCAL